MCKLYWGGERNSCTITTPKGEKQVLTVPVYGSRKVQPVENIRICYMHAWQRQHWATLYSAYGKTPYWQYYADYIRPIYEKQPEFLVDLNNETNYILRCLIRNECPEAEAKTVEVLQVPGILDLLFEYGPETALKI